MRLNKLLHLAHLDPQRVAEDLAWAVLARARRDARGLGLTVKLDTIPPGKDPKAALHQAIHQSKIAKVARTCAEWAITGKGKHEEVAVAMRELRAILEGVEPGAASGRAIDLTPAAALVVVAASARIALGEGRPVEAEEVATLASLDPRTIRGSVKAGALQPVGQGRPMRFAADAVRKFLYVRGVPGFGATLLARDPAILG